MAPSVRLAKFLMKLWQTHPDDQFGDIGEIFNKPEFKSASDQTQSEISTRMAELRFQSENNVPYESYFGIDLSPYFRNQFVLDFGCSNGALARSVIERYEPRNLVGVDLNIDRVRSAKLFFGGHGLESNFLAYGGKVLPFEDEVFDTIYSFDVFEHVSNLEDSLKECYRVLKPGGRLLAVFPGFFHPKEHHLSLVTKTPFVHYFFRPKTLAEAYFQIIDERGQDAAWYQRPSRKFEPWERSYTINGMTKHGFRRLAKKLGFGIELDHALALFETGRMRRANPLLGLFVPVFRFLGSILFLEEVFTHRIVMILHK